MNKNKALYEGRLLTLCLLLMISACGIKPGELSPPSPEAPSSYPRTYLNPATDPVSE